MKITISFRFAVKLDNKVASRFGDLLWYKNPQWNVWIERHNRLSEHRLQDSNLWEATLYKEPKKES